jgi:hypothetical protein
MGGSGLRPKSDLGILSAKRAGEMSRLQKAGEFREGAKGVAGQRSFSTNCQVRDRWGFLLARDKGPTQHAAVGCD